MTFVTILHLMKIWAFLILAFKQGFDKVNKKDLKKFIFKNKIYVTFTDFGDHTSFDENFSLHNTSIFIENFMKISS